MKDKEKIIKKCICGKEFEDNTKSKIKKSCSRKCGDKLYRNSIKGKNTYKRLRKEWLKSKKGKLIRKKILYKYNHSTKGELCRNKYKLTEKNKETRRKIARRWYYLDRPKNKARAVSYYYNKKNEKYKKCSKCGNNNNLEFHHTNYEKNLGYMLCRKCHQKLHKKVLNLAI